MSQTVILILKPFNCICKISREFCVYWRGLTLKKKKKKKKGPPIFQLLFGMNKTAMSNMGS